MTFLNEPTGKTYTMVGNWDAPTSSGLIPTAIAWLFRGIAEQKTKTGARFADRVARDVLSSSEDEPVAKSPASTSPLPRSAP